MKTDAWSRCYVTVIAVSLIVLLFPGCNDGTPQQASTYVHVDVTRCDDGRWSVHVESAVVSKNRAEALAYVTSVMMATAKETPNGQLENAQGTQGTDFVRHGEQWDTQKEAK